MIFTFGYKLPKFISRRLFGDREKYGLVVNKNDPCWSEWQKKLVNFYEENQLEGPGKAVNTAGYKVMRKININGKRILEIGPGRISHLSHWIGRPSEYVIADINPKMLEASSKVLEDQKINFITSLLQDPSIHLPFADNEFDYVISFYSLEHLYPLEEYLVEFKRVLKAGGCLVGAIPTEGGLCWGLGRYFTSRRWLLKNTNINPDKIIFVGNILTSLMK